MQDRVKRYADALFEQSLTESARTLREARASFGATMASRRLTTPLPISGLDPNPEIQGNGPKKLRTANIITDFFPPDVMAEVEELNRDFTRQFRAPSKARSAEPGVKWVSVEYAHKSGLNRALNDQGYELGWVSADKEAEKIEFEGWEYVVVDEPDGRKVQLKIHDHPAVGVIWSY